MAASIHRSATAVWNGSGREGRGTLTTQSRTLDDVPYSFARGSNPEELIAAAHAGCFNMALAFQLGRAGHVPERLETSADVSMAQEGGGWKIDAVTLTLKARVPGISREELRKLADTAEAQCTVSKVLNARVELKTELE